MSYSKAEHADEVERTSATSIARTRLRGVPGAAPARAGAHQARQGEAAVSAARVESPTSMPVVTTASMLEGLAALHPIVLAVDHERNVFWLSDELEIVEDGAASAIGKPVSCLLDGLWPEDISEFGDQTRRFFNEMVENDRVTRARFDLRRDGRPLALEVSGFHARDAQGNDLVVCVADQHRTLESLEQKNEELETYVRSVSHDLRSPLSALLGFSQLLREDHGSVLDESGLLFLDRIEQAGRNMERLLHDMLELSRIEDTSHCRQEVSPSPILEQLKAELKFQLDEKNIRLRLPSDPPMLYCDRTRLYQLLSNLIGNAIHHMPVDAAGEIDVEIESQPDGSQIVVSDNGMGIPAADHERIFGVFETCGSSNGRKQNSGLGLAIVKKIVDAHSGRIWVESEEANGSRFFVWLPTG